ncbi:hypothetical protein PFISCL1PPCAC_25634, partial [Pristionchus fissidentatus]
IGGGRPSTAILGRRWPPEPVEERLSRRRSVRWLAVAVVAAALCRFVAAPLHICSSLLLCGRDDFLHLKDLEAHLDAQPLEFLLEVLV